MFSMLENSNVVKGYKPGQGGYPMVRDLSEANRSASREKLAVIGEEEEVHILRVGLVVFGEQKEVDLFRIDSVMDVVRRIGQEFEEEL